MRCVRGVFRHPHCINGEWGSVGVLDATYGIGIEISDQGLDLTLVAMSAIVKAYCICD